MKSLPYWPFNQYFFPIVGPHIYIYSISTLQHVALKSVSDGGQKIDKTTLATAIPMLSTKIRRNIDEQKGMGQR